MGGEGGGGLGKIGVAKRATFSPSVKRGGGGGGSFWQKSMSPILDINCPPTPTIIFIPAKLSFPEHIFFLQNLPASKNWPEEQILWGTDPLGVPVFHLPCTLHWINKLPVLARGGVTHECLDRHLVRRAPSLTAAYWKPNYKDLHRKPKLLFVNCTLKLNGR